MEDYGILRNRKFLEFSSKITEFYGEMNLKVEIWALIFQL